MGRKWTALLLAAAIALMLLSPIAGTYAAEGEETPSPTAEQTLSATETPVAVAETPAEETLPAIQTPTDEPTSAPQAPPEEAVAIAEQSTTEATADPTTEPTIESTTEPTTDPIMEPTAEPTIEPTTEPSIEPTVEPTAEPTTEPPIEPTTEPSIEPTVEPTVESTAEPPEALSIYLAAGQRSVFANEEAVTLTASVSGGTEPYDAKLVVSRDGDACGEEACALPEAGKLTLNYLPEKRGAYVFSFAVTDASGAQAAASVSVSVARHDAESRETWEESVGGAKLTGDWRIDLVAVAQTQIGYEESTVDFVVDDGGEAHGYTRYGDWYGQAYSEWCAMFVSFCLNYAGIPQGDFPREGSCAGWRERLIGMDAYREDGAYAPSAGDLVFLGMDGSESPRRVGIVEKVEGGKVYAIEGDSAGCVRRCGYSLADGDIVGYADTAALMLRAGVLKPAEDASSPDSTPVPESARLMYTTAASVSLYEQPAEDSAVLAVIVQPGTQVTVHETSDGWCRAEYETFAGYVRAECLAEEAAEVEQPRGEAWAFGEAEATLAFCVAGAESYLWQRGKAGSDGDTVWEAVDGGEAGCLALTVDMQALRYQYRCVARMSDGAQIESDPVTLIRAELVDWLNAQDVRDESMLRRAMSAGSLESIVIEGANVVYVRTGEIVATYDAQTGAIVDADCGLTVAYVVDGAIRPLAASPSGAADAGS